MKNLIYISLCFIILSCSNIKSAFSNDTLDLNDKAIKYELNRLKANDPKKSILYLTAWFEKDTIQIINGKNLLYNEPGNTIAQLSHTTIQVIENTEKVEVNILSKKPTKISLDLEKLKSHKFIYLSRKLDNRKKYVVEYTNRSRSYR